MFDPSRVENEHLGSAVVRQGKWCLNMVWIPFPVYTDGAMIYAGELNYKHQTLQDYQRVSQQSFASFNPLAQPPVYSPQQKSRRKKFVSPPFISRA